MNKNILIHKISAVSAGLLMACSVLTSLLSAQIPHPKDVYGFTPGDDYKLASYAQMQDYYRKLAAASDRVVLKEIGKSVLGRPLFLLIISSEENMKQLDKWRDISEKLARARVDESTARDLARTGRAIVWIDGGLHATEVAHGQMTSLLAHKVATDESSEMRRIRENTILLLMPMMNPDGLDIVRSWYNKQLGTPFETTRPPWLYHHYVGHDNNRDWFMNNMPESYAVTNTLYNEWYPQIVYNHHQSSPSWTRIFLPPFSDPVNPRIHPGVTTGVNLVGSAMANRFAVKEMPGVVSDITFSMWWNGGMRTVPYFHNMIGILTETAHATASPRFYHPDSLPKKVGGRGGSGMPTTGTDIFYPSPWKGGMSRFADPVRYMMTASMALLRIASDRREQWLTNIYNMGRTSINKGEAGSPYAWIIPGDQWIAGEEVNLVNILRVGGVEIKVARADFKAGGKSYRTGDYVLFAGQAFRPYLEDLLEKQEYPVRRNTPNGPPVPPYDLAGWTLPMQMGVQVDKIKQPFSAQLENIDAPVKTKPGRVSGTADYGYAFSHKTNAAIQATNHLLAEGFQIYWGQKMFEAGGRSWPAGTIIVEDNDELLRPVVDKLALELGINFTGLKSVPDHRSSAMKRARIGLYKSWVGNMDEGWTRWLLKEYAFDVDTLHDADIQSGDLTKYRAIVLPHQSTDRILNGHTPGTMPSQYVGGLGLEGTLALKKFVEQGGTLVALDGASDFAISQFGLPVRNVVKGLAPSSFFIPGSLVRLNVETDHYLAYGMQKEAAASFVRSRAFRVVTLSNKGEGGRADLKKAPAQPVEVVARYAREKILMSGWAHGEKKYIGGKAAVLNVRKGKGNIVLFGFRPQFRGQPRATYKLFFNALHSAAFEKKLSHAETDKKK